MGGALDEAAAAVEELVRYPLQWHASMWATIFVDVHDTVPAYSKKALSLLLESFALAFGKISRGAQSHHRSSSVGSHYALVMLRCYRMRQWPRLM